MTRKNKILSAVVFVVAGALTIAFWPTDEKDAMSVTYVGVASNDSSRIVFTLTNRSRASLTWYKHLAIGKNDTFAEKTALPDVNVLNGLSATNFEMTVCTDQRWRMAVWYDRPISEHFLLRWRGKLAAFAFDRTWYRLGIWIQPDPIMLWAYGPVMLGNQPAAAGEK